MFKTTLGLARTLAVLCTLAVANAYAGIYYEATSITKADGASGEGKTSVTVWSEGPATRIEFKDGQQMGMFGPGSYLISKDSGATLYLVNPEDKTYSQFDLGGMLGAADQAMAGMGGMVKMEVLNPHFEKISEAAGETILGYPTQRVVFKSGYTMSISVMGKKMDQVVNMNQEMWMTPSIDPAAFNAWMRPDKLMKGMFKGLGELMDKQFSQVKGAPLKSAVETTTTGGMSDSSKTSIMTTEVTALRKETIPATTFAIPADYKETQLIDEISRADPADQGEAAPTAEDIAPTVEQGISVLRGLFGK